MIATQRKDYYDKLLNMHRIIVDRIEEDKDKTINPFAKANQDKFITGTACSYINFYDESKPESHTLIRQFYGAHENSPITALDLNED